MAVGASKPTVVADADGFFSVKSKMLVSLPFIFPRYLALFRIHSPHNLIPGSELGAFVIAHASTIIETLVSDL